MQMTDFKQYLGEIEPFSTMFFVVENLVNISYAVNPKPHNDEFRKPLRLTLYT